MRAPDTGVPEVATTVACMPWRLPALRLTASGDNARHGRVGLSRMPTTHLRGSATTSRGTRELDHRGASDRALAGNGDHAAREQLVERYRGLARALAARHSEWGEPFDDLLQVAWIGFLKALDRFDPAREVKLATYATATIVGELRRHYRDRAWALHVPRSVRELRARVYAVVDRLTAELGASPTVADIANELNVGEEDVLDAMQAGGARAARTLAPLTEDGESEIDVPYEDSGFAESEARMLVHEGLALARRARAANHRAPLRGRPHPEPDRIPRRHLPDARLAPAAPRARDAARAGRRDRGPQRS